MVTTMTGEVAASAADYTLSSTTAGVTFSTAGINVPSATTAFNVTVNAVADSVVEGAETLRLNFQAASGITGVMGTANPVVVAISDADRLTVAFSQASYSFTEGEANTTGNAVLAVSVTDGSGTARTGGTLAAAATVTVSTTAGTATSPGDFTALANRAVTIMPGDVGGTVNVPLTIVGDTDVVEAEESFELTLAASDARVRLGTSTATVGITDNDRLTVAFASATYSIAEDAGMLDSAMLSVSGGNLAISGGLMVSVSTANGTATAGSDYTALSSESIAIPMADYGTAMTIAVPSVTITDDTTTEGDETFTLTLTAMSSMPITLGTPSVATVTISDDDPLAILSVTDGTATEANTGDGATWRLTFPGGVVSTKRLFITLIGLATTAIHTSGDSPRFSGFVEYNIRVGDVTISSSGTRRSGEIAIGASITSSPIDITITSLEGDGNTDSEMVRLRIDCIITASGLGGSGASGCTGSGRTPDVGTIAVEGDTITIQEP